MSRPNETRERVPDSVAADMVERVIEECFVRHQAGQPAELPDYVVINGHPYRVDDYL